MYLPALGVYVFALQKVMVVVTIKMIVVAFVRILFDLQRSAGWDGNFGDPGS